MKKGIDGLLIVDKPEGITSLDVVREMKHRFGLKKAGHIGTLDPFARGFAHRDERGNQVGSIFGGGSERI